MTVDLLFVGALGPQPGGAVELLFGSTGTPPPPPPVDPPPGLLRLAVAAAWRPAAYVAPTPVAAPWRVAQGLGGAWGSTWAASAPRQAAVRAPWAWTATLRGATTAAPWRSTQQAGMATRAPWRQALDRRGSTALPWQQGRAVAGVTLAAWTAGRAWSAPTAARWAGGRASTAWATARAGQGAATGAPLLARWQAGLPIVSHGAAWSPLPPAGPVPCYLPDPGNAVGLLFRESLTGLAALVFSCRQAAVAVVPVRRVYMVTNVTSLARVDGGASIPCFGFSLSLDVDSWAWGFSASLPADALSLIEPSSAGEPVELAAMVNGTEFRLIAESLSRERTFGQAGIRVQGRGKTAVLDAPYSAMQAFSASSTLTSQQLLDQALPAGWTANWNLTAWSVPGGIWSHQGTPATAAVAIAAAGGGYLQPHASLDQVTVLPRYPTAPWGWGALTPDIELPAAVATREAIEWVEKVRYNAVYVAGTTSGGVGRLVKRAGTAGDIVAQMVTDPLITHTDAARQRGLPVLADTGRVAYVTLRLPVLPATGVIRPGKFVRYVDGAVARLGLVRSVDVDVSLPEVWQTIKVETHVD